MSDYRKLEAYFNIDTGHWCNEQGNPLNPSLVPRFTLYSKTLMFLHLVHNYGTEVTDFGGECEMSFSAFAENTGAIVVHTGSADINKAGFNLQFPEIDPNYGRFAVLVDCNTIELQSELYGLKTKVLNVEFTFTTPTHIQGIIKAKCYFDNSAMTTQTVNAVAFAGAVTTYTKSIPEGLDYITVTADMSKYNLVSAVIEAPEGAGALYLVANVTPLNDGFRATFNATITETGHVLRYSLIRKA